MSHGIPAALSRFFAFPEAGVSREPESWPRGFLAAGVAAGIKASGGKDVMVLANRGPRFEAAGVYTSNRFAAAPVQWSRQALSDGQARLIVANSGGANACTGPEGFADTHATAEHAAAEAGVSAADVAVASTGLIGERLPLERLLAGVDGALGAAREDSVLEAAEAIMTTDSVPKRAEVPLPGGARIVGIAKGAGMLAPALATMLVFITTDAELSGGELDAALVRACAVSFDHADADGCMSTNDTVLLASSGAAGPVDTHAFTEALTALCQDLAYQLIDDAEGARHTAAVTVAGAASLADARETARAICRSNLVKTAIFGEDPNWGRILSAAGTSSAAFAPERVSVSINGVEVCRGGGLGEDRSLVDLSAREVEIVVDLNEGEASATILTSDLTHDYVHENSAYSS
ncbi:bifunctional glutamate N-acetyltransferase/amino-acid acetyltransferase ArgJ [Falsarthrobacter nasiphocae]|uniref:Arginine biosynthesis bifunctional protein ArgJ n=1 Tax=Falsarthrobacter nasiphocae TaxID=189863 RepID=A0AAE3YIM1_9MICC|nr:bifunctional glutamate N-acetyltransferase/amino-acid acetyltransferase ArgJ [Falsarthrobacter nasiphocae]MDR6892706.1 glutamate N-acetyltransferase/amino-acid N-acetyltransferase [Falsarthrobacter nasiphocae]